MTREPNPYAKEPALTTNAAMLMAVPSVVAEDVLDGPDVVDAQHQKNTDIHVSSTDREKWNKVADTHTPPVAVYTCEEDENTIDASVTEYYLLISYLADPTMTSYNEVTLHFSKSAEPDIYGIPWGSDEPVYMVLGDIQTGDMYISTNAILPTPGGVGTFKFATPVPGIALGVFCTDPSNFAEETMKTIGLRISPSDTEANVNGVVMGTDGSQSSNIVGNIICSVRNEYIHAKDDSLHITGDTAEKLKLTKYIAVQGYDNSEEAIAQDSGAVAIGADSKASGGTATAVGNGAHAEGYLSVKVGTGKVIGSRSSAVGFGSITGNFCNVLGLGDVQGDFITALGESHTVADTGVMTFAAGYGAALKTQRTILYLISAGSDLANQYEDGAAALGYVVRDYYGTVKECGTRKLSELLTNNTAFAPANMDLDAPIPTPFLPTGITEPWEEPEQIAEPEETQEKTETLFEKLKAKFAEFLKNNKE